ncbi:MAG: hypothetical protein ABI789_11725 [Usitatibacter sp.]
MDGAKGPYPALRRSLRVDRGACLKSRNTKHGKDSREAKTPAERAILTWEQVQSRLAPIIGEDGFRILFARSLHRARADHPWLARDAVKGKFPFSTLTASLGSQAPALAEEGSCALMNHFNDLLNSLIGKDLAFRLLGKVRETADRPGKQEIDR